MLRPILLLAQTAAVPAPAPAPVSGPVLDQPTKLLVRCDPNGDKADDITVCGRRDDEQYRLRPLGPPPNGKPLPPMTIPVGNGTGDVHAEQRCLGATTICAPALMARLKFAF